MDGEDEGLLRASKIEKAKRFKGIRDIASPQLYEKLIEQYLQPAEEAEVTQAIEGLSQEDEFALMCRMMETATHIVRLDQTPLVRNASIAPDFLVRFQPGCYLAGLEPKRFIPFRAFVEVKSTAKDTFQIGGAQLAKRRAFAQAFDLPLLFAVRFLNIPTLSAWVIVNGSNEEQKTLKVCYTDDVGGGYRSVLWDDFFFMPCPGLVVECIYDPTAPAYGNSHPKYGNLVKLRLISEDQVFSYEVPGAIPVYAMMRCFGLRPAAIRQEGTAFIQTSAPTLIGCSASDMIYKINCMITDETTGQVSYAASRILARADQEGVHFFERSRFHPVALDLLEKGLMYLLWPGSEESHLAIWQHLGGTIDHS